MANKGKMSLEDVMTELEAMGTETTRNIYANHGATGDFFGVKVGDLKTIVKKVKVDHELAQQLMTTNNGDAHYLAGMIADPKLATVNELKDWAQTANWYWISEFAVPGVAASAECGWELGLEWIDSEDDSISSCGWSTLASITGYLPDEELDLECLRQLLGRVEENISDAPNRTRYTMNGFVIAVGSWVIPLTKNAQRVAQSIGKIAVDMGGTACKVPLASERIEKLVGSARHGKKRKSTRC